MVCQSVIYTDAMLNSSYVYILSPHTYSSSMLHSDSTQFTCGVATKVDRTCNDISLPENTTDGCAEQKNYYFVALLKEMCRVGKEGRKDVRIMKQEHAVAC